MILLQRDWVNLSFYFLSGLALSLFYRYSQNIRLQILFHVSWNLYTFISSIWYIIYNWIYFHFFFSKQKQTDSYKVLSVCLFFESIEYFYILFLLTSNPFYIINTRITHNSYIFYQSGTL